MLLFRPIAFVSCLFLVAAVVVKAQDSAKSEPQKGAPAAVAGQSGDHAAAAQAKDNSNQSRYRRHNGRWWYWLPSNRWVVWQNNAWTPYQPGMFATDPSVAATRAPVRRYSYSPGVNDRGVVRDAGSKIRFDYIPHTDRSNQ